MSYSLYASLGISAESSAAFLASRGVGGSAGRRKEEEDTTRTKTTGRGVGGMRRRGSLLVKGL